MLDIMLDAVWYHFAFLQFFGQSRKNLALLPYFFVLYRFHRIIAVGELIRPLQEIFKALWKWFRVTPVFSPISEGILWTLWNYYPFTTRAQGDCNQSFWAFQLIFLWVGLNWDYFETKLEIDKELRMCYNSHDKKCNQLDVRKSKRRICVLILWDSIHCRTRICIITESDQNADSAFWSGIAHVSSRWDVIIKIQTWKVVLWAIIIKMQLLHLDWTKLYI